jgi:hypothetical protein
MILTMISTNEVMYQGATEYTMMKKHIRSNMKTMRTKGYSVAWITLKTVLRRNVANHQSSCREEYFR